MRHAALGATLLLAAPALGEAPAAGHANHFADVAPTADGVSVEVKDAWARDAEANVQVTVWNRSPDWVVFDVRALRLLLGEEVPVTAGLRFTTASIPPDNRDLRVLVAKGDGLHVERGALVMHGLARVAANSPVVAAPDLRIPLEAKTLEAGPFTCDVPGGRVKKDARETALWLRCFYKGTGVGFVDGGKIRARLEDGRFLPNGVAPRVPAALHPGDQVTVTVQIRADESVAGMATAPLHLVFGDTFREGTPVPIDLPPIPLVLDPARTAAKNAR